MMRQLVFTAALLGATGACSDGALDVFVESEAAATAGTGPDIPDPILPSPTGGTGGTGAVTGESGAAGTPTATDPLLIDDFEDGNTQCVATSGFWYLVSDTTGVQEMTFDVAPDWPTQALHLRGGGFSQWGTALGLDIAGSDPVFDATAYSELRFYARAEPGSTTDIEVHILESDLHFSAKVPLTGQWSEFVLPFGRMLSTAGDPTRPLDPAAISAIQFFVLSDAEFDYWLDDVVFAP